MDSNRSVGSSRVCQEHAKSMRGLDWFGQFKKKYFVCGGWGDILFRLQWPVALRCKKSTVLPRAGFLLGFPSSESIGLVPRG